MYVPCRRRLYEQGQSSLRSLSCRSILGLWRDDTEQSPRPPAVDMWQEGVATLGCLTHLRCCDCHFSVHESTLTDAGVVLAVRCALSALHVQRSRVRVRCGLLAVTVLLLCSCLQHAVMMRGKQS